MLNLNTGKTSWWFASSFSCRAEISSELEKLQIQEQLSSSKTLVDELNTTVSISTTTIHDMLNSLVLFNSDPKYKHLNKFIESNCLIPFYLIEIVHSGVLILLGVNLSIFVYFIYYFFKFKIFVIIFGLLLSNALNDEDDSCKCFIDFYNNEEISFF